VLRVSQAYIDEVQQSWLVAHVRGYTLHVGCGEKPISGAVNIDPNPSRAPWRNHDWDVHDLPCEAESFDTVLSSHVLPALHDIDRAMEEMIRVLRPGGVMAHVIPDWRYAPRRLDPRFPWDFQHQGWLGPGEFFEFIAQYDDRLRVQELRSFSGFDWAFRVRAERL